MTTGAPPAARRIRILPMNQYACCPILSEWSRRCGQTLGTGSTYQNKNKCPNENVSGNIYEVYSESNVRWSVNKTSNEKRILLYTKYACILKLLLNVVTAGIEALVSGNKFLYGCVKEVCRLWAQTRFDTFHQLPIIVQALWSHPVLQVGIQAVVARSEIRADRSGQLKCCSRARMRASVCGRALSWRSTTPCVSIPRLLLWMAGPAHFF
jgi:hypothetical protein